jgi:nitric oxide reductase subunit B
MRRCPIRSIRPAFSLPVGLAQTWASVEHGYWFARSSEFLQSPLMQRLRWMRIPGDTVFALGALVLVAFVFIGRSKKAATIEIPQGVRVPAGD